MAELPLIVAEQVGGMPSRRFVELIDRYKNAQGLSDA